MPRDSRGFLFVRETCGLLESGSWKRFWKRPLTTSGRPYTGAGWIMALCGDMQTMPGYGKSPAAVNVDIDGEGRVVGLF